MFVFASVLTLVLGHIASGYHRRAEEWDAGGDLRLAASSEDLKKPAALALSLPRRSVFLLVVGLLGTAGLVLAGAFVTSFEMVESGALSTLMLDEPGKIAEYSLVVLGQSMTAGNKSTDFGLLLVQVIFFVFALVIPLALQFSILLLLSLPLPHARQLVLFDICRALDAWAALDVFAAAVTVAHIEYGIFSTFIMRYNNLEHGCKLVETYLHTECFHMECSLSTGFALLFLGAVLSSAMPKVAFKECRAALERRAQVGNDSLRREVSFSSDLEDEHDLKR